MHGARAERASGRLLHVGPWIGRAVASLARAAVYDKSNLMPAKRTIAKVGKQLLTKNSARAATQAWNKV